MLNSFINELQLFLQLMQNNLFYATAIVAVFWICYFISLSSGYRLNAFGIYPRHPFGLVGIIFYSFLHSNFNHLFFNSIPLLVLIDFVLIDGWPKFIQTSLFILFLGGFLLWLVGRRAIHIGASCLVMGYLGYLLANAYQHPSVSTVLLGLICLYYFGGLLAGLLPGAERVSWEGHLCGFAAGVAAAFLPTMNIFNT